jgi:hypothetical protein
VYAELLSERRTRRRDDAVQLTIHREVLRAATAAIANAA